MKHGKTMTILFSLFLALAMIPLAVMTVLFTLVPSLTGSTSFMIIPSGALAILLAWLKYRKEMKGAAGQ